MRIFLRSRVIEWMLLGCASYWLFAPFIPLEILFTVINGALMALWIGLMITYWRGTWDAVRDSTNPLGGKIALTAVAVLSVAITAIFTWGWFYQYLEQPLWMRNSIFRGWISWIFLVGTIMLMLVPSTEDSKFLSGNSWRRVGTVTAMAVILILALLYTIGGFDP